MANYKIKFNPPMEVVRQKYKDKIDSIKNLSAVYAKVSIFLDRWVQSNFRTQGDKVGGWKKLALGGRRRKKGKKSTIDASAKILQDTGRLKASFLPFATRRNAGVGSELPYSKTHEKGIGHVPKRRILPVNKEVMPSVKKIVNKHVKRSLEK